VNIFVFLTVIIYNLRQTLRIPTVEVVATTSQKGGRDDYELENKEIKCYIYIEYPMG